MHFDKISILFFWGFISKLLVHSPPYKKINCVLAASSSEQQLEGCLKYCCCVWKTLIRTLFVRLHVCQHWYIKEFRSTELQYKVSRTGSNGSPESCTKIRWEKCEVHLKGGNCFSLFTECRWMSVDLDGAFLNYENKVPLNSVKTGKHLEQKQNISKFENPLQILKPHKRVWKLSEVGRNRSGGQNHTSFEHKIYAAWAVSPNTLMSKSRWHVHPSCRH